MQIKGLPQSTNVEDRRTPMDRTFDEMVAKLLAQKAEWDRRGTSLPAPIPAPRIDDSKRVQMQQRRYKK